MSYLVIIRAEDREAVKALVGEYRDAVGIYHWTDADSETCRGDCRGNKSLGGWTRHPKRGHMMHECGKRNPRWREFFQGALRQYLGNNLLARDKTPEQFQNPEGWGK